MYICKQWAQPYSEKATYVEGVAKKFLKGELQSCVCVCVCVCACLYVCATRATCGTLVHGANAQHIVFSLLCVIACTEYTALKHPKLGETVSVAVCSSLLLL